VGVVLSWCQKVIDKQPGGVSFEEKLKVADFETLNLFKSINLLQEQLALANIIANPDTVKYGKIHRSKIHPFILKHVRLFEPLANDNKCTISLKGHTEAEIATYNSFQFIPLILIDNAVKYSLKNNDIIVKLREEGADVTISVTSYGRIVPIDYREKIFEKYIRGPNVEKDYPDGMGVGLYIAQLIAMAHGAKILYSCSGSGSIGYNEFCLTIKRRCHPSASEGIRGRDIWGHPAEEDVPEVAEMRN
jgi:signal transduction histidine kinase